MSLEVDLEMTEELRTKDIKAWKVLGVKHGGDQLWSCITGYGQLQYHPGCNEDPQGQVPDKLYEDDQWYEGGIHIFLKREDAEIVIEDMPNRRILEVECRAEDLVAAGPGYNRKMPTAMYRKIYISQEEFDKAISKEQPS